MGLSLRGGRPDMARGLTLRATPEGKSSTPVWHCAWTTGLPPPLERRKRWALTADTSSNLGPSPSELCEFREVTWAPLSAPIPVKWRENLPRRAVGRIQWNNICKASYPSSGPQQDPMSVMLSKATVSSTSPSLQATDMSGLPTLKALSLLTWKMMIFRDVGG